MGITTTATKRPVICTSISRPTTPTNGMMIFETDTNQIRFWNTTVNAWIRTWSEPWGSMGLTTVSADQTGITTITDLTGFTVTFTAVANRIYHVHYTLGVTQVTTAGSQMFNLYDSATDLGIAFRQNPVAAGALVMVSGFFPVTSLAVGSRTIKLRGQTSAGTMTISSGSLVNGRFAVTDVGPNGGP